MKNFIFRFFTASFICILMSCTHNNGDIGDYFGTWKLTHIEIDGHADDSYKGNIFWQFQSQVFCMRQVLPEHDIDVRWGSWKELPDNVLELNFTHHDDEHPAGSDYYSPLPATGLAPAVNHLDIVTMNSSEMVLTYHNDKGETLRYRLKKW